MELNLRAFLRDLVLYHFSRLIEMSGNSEGWTVGKLQVFSQVAVIRAIGSDVFELSNLEAPNPKTSNTLEKVLNIVTTILIGLNDKNSTVSTANGTT